jgi:DNA-binding winged helix-turn-helix (wHTH) protein
VKADDVTTTAPATWRFDGNYTTGPTEKRLRVPRARAAILQTLISADGRLITHERMWDAAYRERWLRDDVAPEPKSLAVHICWLRRYFAEVGVVGEVIATVHGEGHKLVQPPAAQPTDTRIAFSAAQWSRLMAVMRAAEKLSPGTINQCGLGGLINAD